MIGRLLLVSLIALASSMLHAADLRVIGWNVEDDGSIPQAIEQRLRQLVGQEFALWGLAEVDPDNFDRSVDALQQRTEDAGLDADYDAAEGQTGNNIRLMIIYDKNRIEKLQDSALSGLQFGSGGRAPLLVRGKDKIPPRNSCSRSITFIEAVPRSVNSRPRDSEDLPKVNLCMGAASACWRWPEPALCPRRRVSLRRCADERNAERTGQSPMGRRSAPPADR